MQSAFKADLQSILERMAALTAMIASSPKKWQINADLEYRWDIGGSKEAFLGANYSYRSSTYGDFKPDARLFIDDYGLLDLRAGVEEAGGKWTASFYAQNVTNEYYWNTAARRGDAVIRFAGMPVTYGLNVAFKFR